MDAVIMAVLLLILSTLVVYFNYQVIKNQNIVIRDLASKVKANSVNEALSLTGDTPNLQTMFDSEEENQNQIEITTYTDIPDPENLRQE